MAENNGNGKRKPGRPQFRDGATYDADDVEMRYVFGELKIGRKSKKLKLVYPSVRELGQRYDVTGSAIHTFLTGRNALERRNAARDEYGEAGLVSYARSQGRWHPKTLEEQPDDIDKLNAELPHQTNGGGPPTPGRGMHSLLDPEGKIHRPGKDYTGRLGYDFVPVAEIDRVLVHGLPTVDPDTGSLTVRFPQQPEIADMFNTTPAVVGKIWRDGDCKRRRENALDSYRAQIDRIMVDYRIECAQEARDQVIGIIDEFVQRFGEAVRMRRVRFDGPADFDRLVRLRELLVGAPDTRAEIQGHVTLEALQDRHKRYQAAIRGESPSNGDARVIEAVDEAVKAIDVEPEGENPEDEIARLRARLAQLEGPESPPEAEQD